MQLRTILGGLVAIGVTLALSATAPAAATDASASPAVVETSPSTVASSPASSPEPSATPSTPVSSPAASPSCEASRPACNTTLIVVIVGAPCDKPGEKGQTTKGEECSCKKPADNQPAEWVKVSNPKASDSLPVTGASTGLIAMVAAGLLTFGAVLFLAARRRRIRFTA